MTEKECLALLETIALPCYDNGKKFTNTEKLDKIAEILNGTGWIRTEKPLYHLYSRKPIEKMENTILVISSHADIVREITKPFSDSVPNDSRVLQKALRNTRNLKREDLIHGTYDNAITNAALLSLMIENRLPENVVAAFTGNEESGLKGAFDLTRDLKTAKKKFRAIVLDVTWEGWDEACGFTIENDFWGNKWGKASIKAAEDTGINWQFVPVDPDDIGSFVPHSRIIDNSSMEDESWGYDDEDVEAFSLCIPTFGSMHSNIGLLARKSGFMQYREALAAIAGAEL